jgi:hypothetical protein
MTKKGVGVGLASVVLASALATYWLLARPTPESAARVYAYRMMEGDVDWIYEHATEEEKNTPGFTRELVRSFYAEFLRQPLAGSHIRSAMELTPFSKTMCTAQFEIALRSGETVPVSVFAFVEEGQIRIGAAESLLHMAALIHFRQLPGVMDRIRAGWKKYAAWYVEHGMPNMYSSQDGGTITLKKKD